MATDPLFPQRRMRRLRRTPALRELVAQTRLDVADFIAPVFVLEDLDEAEPIVSMPGVVQHSRASLVAEAKRLSALGVRALMLFGVPADKDARGSGASVPDGIVQVALRDLREALGDEMVLMADLCLDEYTDHGHCGILDSSGAVDNDATLERYQEIAISQADAGADFVAPSGMMDGQVAAIRDALDSAGSAMTAILAYSAKYASALYGPFRDAVQVQIVGGGDRRGYQQDPANAKEALEEVRLDVAEGADMVMVKPALFYLDILREVAKAVPVPVAAYQVSGEYAMLASAADRGLLDRELVLMESLVAIKRAGADLILTYFAGEAAELLAGLEMTGEQSHALFERALRVIPGGVDSPVRAFGSVGGEPFFVASAEGPLLTDVDGREFLDYVQSWGASILGHADDEVIAAIKSASERGSTYGAPTAGEVRLAEAVVGRVPGAEMVRFVSSGTEAAMTAVRLARGITARERILKFAGCYHGHSDALLAQGGSGVATLGLSGSAGVTSGAVADTIVAPYNVLPDLDESVAAVIVEPVAANMGLVAPVPGFLEGLRARCDEVGALLIFDEVITGFRVASSGAAGYFGIQPDLYCLGKVLGGGLPLGAIAGPARHLGELAPTGPVYQAGTLSGNPLATAAGLVVLERLDESAYKLLAARAEQLCEALSELFAAHGVAAQLPRVASLFGIFFSDELVLDYDDARASAANGHYRVFFNEMLKRGVFLPPSPYEVMFLSLSHGENELERTLDAAGAALSALSSAERS